MPGRSSARLGAQFLSVSLAGLALATGGCRFGATGTDPFADMDLADAAPSSGGQGGTPDTGGATDTGGTTDTSPSGGAGAGGTTSSVDAGGFVGAQAGGSGNALGSTFPPDSGFPGVGGAPSGCGPAQPAAICDPVRNVGCLVPFSACDIDPTQAVPSGRCVFPFASAPANTDAGASCQVNATTETCVPSSTCVGGACRKLCYCDADCVPGECCTEVAPGASGVFKLCKAC